MTSSSSSVLEDLLIFFRFSHGCFRPLFSSHQPPPLTHTRTAAPKSLPPRTLSSFSFIISNAFLNDAERCVRLVAHYGKKFWPTADNRDRGRQKVCSAAAAAPTPSTSAKRRDGHRSRVFLFSLLITPLRRIPPSSTYTHAPPTPLSYAQHT